MFSFKRKPGRTAFRAGLLAGALAATSVASGLGASSALALKTQCEGGNITGEGSTLQKISQAVWTSNEAEYKALTGKASLGASLGFNRSADGTACKGTQGSGGKPTVTYTGTGSGAGLAAYGVNSGTLKLNGGGEVADKYIGTDDAPKGPVGTSTTQLGEMRTAFHTKSGTAESVVVPVTQTAIAVIANPPVGCTISQISNANLEKAFRGNSGTTWKSIGAKPEGSEPESKCEVPVVRVVREDGSGSSYQFKHYLFTVSSAKVKTTELGEVTWAELQNQTESGGHVPNKIWPDEAGTTEIIRGNGGGALVEKVNGKDGSIGYAALPDAEGTHKTGSQVILEVQDFTSGGVLSYASPAETTNEKANCENTAYGLPKESTGAEEKTLTQLTKWSETGKTNLDWSEVYGSNKNIGSGIYSICTLTWDVVPSNATGVYGSSAATTAQNYLKYVTTTTGGQADLAKNWYAPLPTVATSNVQEAAEKAVALIG